MATAPNKEERQKCYVTRDAYFKCLDENNDDIYKCTETLTKFEKMCPKAWIKHFGRTRDKDLLDKVRQKQRKIISN